MPEVLLLYRLHESQISTVTSVQQYQLTQQIRRRYWKYVFDTMRLDQGWIDEVLNICESAALIPNMDAVDAALTGLLQHSHGEARNVILSHAMRLFFRIAVDCPDVTSRWQKLNQEVGERTALSALLKLWLLHNLKIRPNSRVFALVKKFHISLIRKT